MSEMHANFSLSRRRLISYLSVVAVGGLARPVVAGERQTALANLASAAISPGIPSAIGLIQITGERIGEPLVLGVKAVGSTERARVGDRWHIGSNAKSITATMIARLVEGQPASQWRKARRSRKVHQCLFRLE
ncbi:hypothetical protein HL653_10940 [Sphingomonas sp. AP4-R1]|uniref:hypothetical protein n=1 Tax=Sphingomonas sp. AP4-R1 TaxID=2735134 RepID=UPI001493AA19|nr:hypothetical protein [Sphingomonas sp. AP4-R1]QJU58236.1 hypothetical protein HL653_10940 [Sphingomonas sp. AP4-R1]